MAPDLALAMLSGAQTLAAAVLGGQAWAAARRTSGHLSHGWRFIAGLAVVAGAASTLQAWLALHGHGFSGTMDEAWHTGHEVAAFLSLILLFPVGIRTIVRWRMVLDALLMGSSLLGLGVVAYNLGLVDVAAGEIGALVLDTAMGGAVVALVATVLVALPAPRPRWYLLFCAAALLLLASALLAFAGNDAWIASDLIEEGAYLLTLPLVAYAAAQATPWTTSSPPHQSFRAQMLPYVPFAAYVAIGVPVGLRPGAPFSLTLAGTTVFLLFIARTALLLVELNSAQRSLGESNRFKTQLLRMMSHELANPLSTLRLQLALAHKVQPVPDGKASSIIERSVTRLESLSNDVRVMALAESGRLVATPKPDDLAKIVAAAVAAQRPLAAARGLELAMRDAMPATVNMDAQRIGQVMDNLLSNAIKFTPSGGRIAVAIEPSNDAVAVRVNDTGAGLTEDQCKALFSAFSRPLGEVSEGLGLGLYLCRLIVTAHGGKVGAESPGPGAGSVFWFSLPSAPSAVQDASSPLVAPPTPAEPPRGFP